MGYIKRDDLDNFMHLQIPRKVWNMYLNKEISPVAFKIYIEFFDRLKISAYNNWIDENGNVYIKYSYEEMMDILNVKSKGTISDALKELKDLKLILQEKGFNTSSKFFLSNILQNGEIVQSSEKTNNSSPKNQTTEVRKIEQQSSEKSDANHNYFNHNNINNNNNNNDKKIAVEILEFLKENHIDTKAIQEAVLKYDYTLVFLKNQLKIALKLKELGKYESAGACFSNALTKNIILTLPEEKPKQKPVFKELGKKEKEIIEKRENEKESFLSSAMEKEKLDKYFDLLSDQEKNYINQESLKRAREVYGEWVAPMMAKNHIKYEIIKEYKEKNRKVG